jgi:hypothetical protein
VNRQPNEAGAKSGSAGRTLITLIIIHLSLHIDRIVVPRSELLTAEPGVHRMEGIVESLPPRAEFLPSLEKDGSGSIIHSSAVLTRVAH